MPVQSSQINSKLQNVYIGLDVHLKQWNVSIIHGGIKRKSFQQTPSVDALMNHLKNYYPGCNYYSAYEAGVCGYAIHYELVRAGVHNIIVNAADISQSTKDRVRKTDSLDAAKIARELESGHLKCIYIPAEDQLEDRSLLRCRQLYVSDSKRWKCRIRHFLHTNGIEIPEEFRRGKWPKAFFEWLHTCADSIAPRLGSSLRTMVETLVQTVSRIKTVENQILALMKSEKYAANFELLQTCPGVGKITAFAILLECGDLSSFSSADKFCAFIGLIPDMDQSDDHQGRCDMTRRRHRMLRYMITECVSKAISDYPEVSKTYARHCHRMHPNKAKVKIAHKLAKCIKFVVRNQKPYDPSKWT